MNINEISPKTRLGECQPGRDTDLLPVEPFVASGVFKNIHW